MFHGGSEYSTDYTSAIDDDIDGVFLFTGLHAGSYTVCLNVSNVPADDLAVVGYASQCFDDFAWDPAETSMATAAAHADTFTLAAGEMPYLEVDLDPLPTATVAGTVTAENGDPLQNVQVWIRSYGRSDYLTYTDEDGNYSAPVVAAADSYVCFLPGRRRKPL